MECENNENKKKSGRDWPILKKIKTGQSGHTVPVSHSFEEAVISCFCETMKEHIAKVILFSVRSKSHLVSQNKSFNAINIVTFWSL